MNAPAEIKSDLAYDVVLELAAIRNVKDGLTNNLELNIQKTIWKRSSSGDEDRWHQSCK